MAYAASPIFWGVCDHCGLGLWHVRPAVGQLVEPFVIPHRERHVALLTLEASFVPYLEQIAAV